jgi:hypothetical protein
MSSSLSFALASFGIALGKSLPSSVFKRTSKKASFSPASGLAAASAIDFSSIDALPDFGVSDPQFMDLLGSYFLRVFNLSESSWRVQLLDRLLSFDSPGVPLDLPLSAAMSQLGVYLSLDPSLLEALPFSASPPPSAFCPSADSVDFLTSFYSGFIMLWAIRVHIPNTSVETLLPSSRSLASSSTSSSASGSSSSSASSSGDSGPSSGLSLRPSVGQLPLPPADATLTTLVSQLSAQLASLSQQVAALQQSPSSAAHAQPSAPVHPMGPTVEGNPVSPFFPLSDYSADTDSSPSPGVRQPNFSLSPEDANAIILTDCADGARLSPAKLADGLASGGVFLCSPTGGHFRIVRVKGVLCFHTVNEAADRPGPGFQSLTSAPQFQWPQNRSELILWQSEHADILSRDLSRRLTAAGSDSSISSAALTANVAASRAVNQFHQRALELTDAVFSNSRATESHVSTWSWLWFFLYRTWNVAWASHDFSTFASSFVPTFQHQISHRLAAPISSRCMKTALLFLGYHCEAPSCLAPGAHIKFCPSCRVGFPELKPQHSKSFAAWQASTSSADKSEKAYLSSPDYARLKASFKGSPPKDPAVWYNHLASHQSIIPQSRGLTFD